MNIIELDDIDTVPLTWVLWAVLSFGLQQNRIELYRVHHNGMQQKKTEQNTLNLNR